MLGALGEGGFGSVLLVRRKDDDVGTLLAMKVVSEQHLSRKAIARTISEVEAMKALALQPHPFIAPLHAYISAWR